MSLSLAAGEVLGIAGVEGNGQKQLAEALAGQRPVSAGLILLEGEEIQALDVAARQRRGLRYITDDRLGEGTIAALPIEINLLLKRIGEPPFWRHGVAQPKAIERHARDLIRRYDIRTPNAATAIGRLSGGNIQKALLARELEGQPKAVIYNKPTHGLDLHNAQRARAAIAAQAQKGTASLLISTDLDEILELSDRIAVMSAGALTAVVANDENARARVARLMTDSSSQI